VIIWSAYLYDTERRLPFCGLRLAADTETGWREALAKLAALVETG
jgi:hypothetical protein